MWSKGKEYGLMVYDKKDFPVAYFDDYDEVADFLGVTRNSVYCAVCNRGGSVRGHVVSRVPIGEEE